MNLRHRVSPIRPVRALAASPKKISKGVGWWVSNGAIFVCAQFDGDALSQIRIEFHKETARIPSLKNSKLPGRNFINPDTLDRLRAMDALFIRSTSVYPRQRLTFRDQDVGGLLICSKRPTRFDLDNCVASIKDWCEPAQKRGRGWGVGLVEDDSKLNVFAVHAAHTGRTLDHSVLILQPWHSIKDHMVGFMGKAFKL